MTRYPGWLAANRDLVAVAALVAAALVASASGETGAVWLPVALPLLLVLPGYVTVTFAYAKRSRERWTFTTSTKRLGFALGGSLAILPVLAILTYVSQLELTPRTLTITVSGYVILGTVATALRRNQSSRGAGEDATTAATREPRALATLTRLARQASLLQVVLAVSIVAAVATLGVAVAVPSHGATSSDLHLLTEQDGRLVANNYPDTLAEGESRPITVGVTNDEHQPMEYTVVAELQQVTVGNRTVTIEERREVGRYAFGLAHNQTWNRRIDIPGVLTGTDLRFTVYLYRGEPPATPTAGSAYRNTYIWIDVQPANGA